MTPNADLLATARSNVIETQNYAHRNAILRGDWDDFALVKAEVERLLKNPPHTDMEAEDAQGLE